jgi:hypothetical protein
VAAGDDEGDRGAGVDLTAAVDERGALKRPPALGRIDDRAQAGVRVEGVDRAVLGPVGGNGVGASLI